MSKKSRQATKKLRSVASNVQSEPLSTPEPFVALPRRRHYRYILARLPQFTLALGLMIALIALAIEFRAAPITTSPAYTIAPRAAMHGSAFTVPLTSSSASNVIYLTFDDGPGVYTATLLDTLQRYHVPATFFVTGAGDDALILREYQEGHSVGLHTFSHNYAYIYASMSNFFADLTAAQDRVRSITGYTTYLMRFPGGSSNLISARYDGGTHLMSQLTPEVERRGFTFFDWNVVSGDAGDTTETDVVYQNVVSNLKDGPNVVLQHDIKEFSVAAVEHIIQYGLEHGYIFARLTADSPTMHHGVNN